MNSVNVILLVLSFLTGFVCIALYSIWSVLHEMLLEIKMGKYFTNKERRDR